MPSGTNANERDTNTLVAYAMQAGSDLAERLKNCLFEKDERIAALLKANEGLQRERNDLRVKANAPRRAEVVPLLKEVAAYNLYNKAVDRLGTPDGFPFGPLLLGKLFQLMQDAKEPAVLDTIRSLDTGAPPIIDGVADDGTNRGIGNQFLQRC
jgi:hypothetical protein